MTENERRFYSDSWTVQDACNLRGVTIALCRHLEALEIDGMNDAVLRKHAATLTWMDKINDLVGRPAVTSRGRDTDGRTVSSVLREMWCFMCDIGQDDGIGEQEIRQNATTMTWVSAVNAMLGNPEDHEIESAMSAVLLMNKE